MAQQQGNQESSGSTAGSQDAGSKRTDRPSPSKTRYAEGAPDSSRQFGEAADEKATSLEDTAPPERKLRSSADEHSDEVPFQGSGRLAGGNPSSKPSDANPARGPGVPVSDENLPEVSQTPVDDKTGEIESGRRTAPGASAGRGEPNEI
ncbi:MAG TPA: hypothetical protein VNT79_07850 [Phycisphaerae bacterium]|nr:hypothetical protein [Phycisphaerae bacterium]